MPSRSKIFSRLRGRSRSVARKNGGQRLAEDPGEETERRNRATTAPVPPPTKSSARVRRAAGAPPPPPLENGANKKSPSSSERPTASPQAASANENDNGARYVMKTPAEKGGGNSGKQHEGTPPTDTSRDTTTSTAASEMSDYHNDQFVTAFAQAPSFDKFDSDILLSDTGVFPQPTSIPRSESLGGGNSGGRSHQQLDVAQNGSYTSDGEPHSVGPHGIRWGESSVNNDEEGYEVGANNNAVHVSQDCFSGSADPPAILIGLDEDDLIDDDEVDHGVKIMDKNGHPGTDHNQGANDKETLNINKDQGTEWFNSFTNSQWEDDEPKNKNRRLVSPSEVKVNMKTVGNHDFADWGRGAKTTDQDPQKSDDAFGSNFFKSNEGFHQGDDGFGTTGDAFFGNTWTNVNASNQESSASKQIGSSPTMESDPWAGASFADAVESFNYSRSNEEPDQDPMLEEKKDDDISGESAAPNTTDPPSLVAQDPASKVWDGQADGTPPALMPPSQVGQGSSSKHSRQHHPLNAPSAPTKQGKQEVVVTFDKSLTDSNSGRNRPPSTSYDRKVSQGSGAVVPATSHRNQHRRVNSKESLSSHRSQLSHSHQRRSKKGGGSVGSNSSAVDQILEHYRQKRRMAKDKAGGRVTSGGSVHSGVQQGGGGGSVSVASGSQFSTPGSGSGVGTSVGNGAAGVVVRAGSVASGLGGGSGGSVHGGHARHRRIPSGGSSSHRRNLSSESVSRIIDNLEIAAAASGRSVAGSGCGGSGHGGHTRHRRNRSGASSIHRRSGNSANHARSPSNESVSRIIDNLETAAAATGRGKAAIAHRAPSPAMGNYYPPLANGYVGGGMASGGGDDAADHNFLMANIEATIGPRGVAPDMESLSGRSVRSHRSQSQTRRRSSSNNRHRSSSSRPHRSPPTHNRYISGDASVDSRASRNSFRTYQSTRSALTTMSKETQSVANDLFRLEAQLAEVARQQEDEDHLKGGTNRAATKPPSAYSASREMPVNNNINNTLGAEPVPRPTPFHITAPPGKLGILLSNKMGQRGPTHVSAVRSESVLAGKVHVGDIFMSIDGEDVTRMNSKEITTIMARKTEFERVLRFRPLVSSAPQRNEWI